MEIVLVPAVHSKKHVFTVVNHDARSLEDFNEKWEGIISTSSAGEQTIKIMARKLPREIREKISCEDDEMVIFFVSSRISINTSSFFSQRKAS